jgi:glycosyltransferase involved in cell wall biosynthesis
VTIAAAAGSPRHVVCHFIERLDHGGGERIVHSLATGMRGTAYVPVVCCLQPGAVARLLERDGVRVHILGIRRRSVLQGPLFLLFLLQLFWRLARLLKRERVAILHAHLPDSIIWATVAGALTRTPVVGTYHGLGVMPRARGALDPRNALRRALYRMSGRLAARTIAVSTPIRDMLCAQMGFDERKTVLLLNGVDTERFATAVPCGRAQSDLGLEDRTVVICVGRLVAGKGQRHLVDAMALVVREHPAAALLLVGEGPDRPLLEDRARELGLSDRVRFSGERSDVPELLAMSAVFVLPSFSEGIPLAVVEAMAAGKPVVVTRVPGCLDVVVDERFGLLVQPGDAAELADAICKVLNDPAGAAALGARGQQRARTHFGIERSLRATEALYDDVLRSR